MTTMTPAYRYRATLVRVIDGDTFVMDVDLGLRVHAVIHVRLRGWNAPELATPDGSLVRARAVMAFSVYKSIIVETYKDQQTFARWVADIWLDGVPLVTLLQPVVVEPLAVDGLPLV